MAKNVYKEVRSTKERPAAENLNFPKMGTSILSSVVNVSGRRSSYTTMTPKKTEGRGASPTGKKVNRGHTLIHEAHGPSFHIVATLYKPNAAEASMTQKNTRPVPPLIERPDHVGSAKTFWQKRQYGQKT